jgi:hypothetical protein
MRTRRSTRLGLVQAVSYGSVVLLALALSFSTDTAFAIATSPTAHSRGAIAGQLGIEGGPCCVDLHPTAGLVKVAGPESVRAVKVPKSGDFTIHVAPGSYTLTGCGGTKDKQCGPAQDVTVQAGTTTQVQVVWLLAP